jgi:hypothetical protein
MLKHHPLVSAIATATLLFSTAIPASQPRDTQRPAATTDANTANTSVANTSSAEYRLAEEMRAKFPNLDLAPLLHEAGRSAQLNTSNTSGTLYNGAVAWRKQTFAFGSDSTSVSYVWINLTHPDIIVSTSPSSFYGLAGNYVANNSKVLAAVNANFFEYSNLTCSSTKKVLGISVSEGLRRSAALEIPVLPTDRFTVACDWSNVCFPIQTSVELDTATRNGTSRWKNVVTGGKRLVNNGVNTCGADCDERDTHVAIGLAGSRPGGGFSSMYFVVADGNDVTRTGWTLNQFTNFLANNLLVSHAVQMDGGGSGQLAVVDYSRGTRGASQLNFTKRPVCANPLALNRDVPVLFTVRTRN